MVRDSEQLCWPNPIGRPLLGLAILAAIWGIALVAVAQGEPSALCHLEASGSYTLRTGDTREQAQVLATFEAKRRVVDQAGDLFIRQEMIAPLNDRREAVFNLAADALELTFTQVRWDRVGTVLRCTVQLTGSLAPKHFVEAEEEDRRLEKAANEVPFRQEMEPAVPSPCAPGHDLAKANRLLRQGKYRMAVIYLDRLAAIYTNWPEIYLLKADACGHLLKPLCVRDSLQRACGLDNPVACERLRTLP